MAYQVQMNTIDESGNATPIYPKNRKKDVFVGAFEATADAVLPGESADETLGTTLSLIKAYLSKLKTAAYANVAESIADDATTVPSTKLLFNVNKIAGDALPKSGGEMSGDITMNPTYDGDNVTHKIVFPLEYYNDVAYSYICAKSVIYGSELHPMLAFSTFGPYDDTATIGTSGNPWSHVYADIIDGFNLNGSIVPVTDLEAILGSEDHKFSTAHINTLKNVTEISFVHDSYEPSSIIATYEQYDRYGWRAALQFGCSLIPSNNGVNINLGDSTHSFSSLYANYLYKIRHIGLIGWGGGKGAISVKDITNNTDCVNLELEYIRDISPTSGTYPLTLGCGSHGISKINVTEHIMTDTGSAIIGGQAYKPSQGYYSYPFANIYSKRLSITDGSDASYQWSIEWNSSVSIVYSSSPLESASMRGVYMGSSSLHSMLFGYRIGLNATSAISTNKSFIQYSDEKVKRFTDDINDDIEKIIELFDNISVRSFNLKYSIDDKVSIGLNAQEFKRALEKCGIDPFKYEMLDVQYNTYIRRGIDAEDDKFYPVFYSIAYDQLHTLSLIKIRDMEQDHTARLAELEAQNKSLEDRLKAIESKLG